MQSWNGYSILRHPALLIPPDFTAQTDASGIWGCAAVLETEWSQWQWPQEWLNVGIVAKELAPNLFTCVTWGNELCHHNISFEYNNESIVAAIKKASPKDALVMHLLRCLRFFITHFDISIAATTADHLSRGNLIPAILSYPALSQQPNHLPTSIFSYGFPSRH